MSTDDRTHDPLGLGPRLHDLDTLLRENERLRKALDDCTRSHQRMNVDYERALGLLEETDREALAALYEATADLLDFFTGMSEGEPRPVFEAAERALALAAARLGRTGQEDDGDGRD